ncbi:TBC1 domain family member 19 [Lepeophtheirus salmonis]|uniref:TBC1 domain family member 19 n=1 Tax=Lepeophtheirus salmonis TaxID=72036 RepID=A0A7R8D674_LEPSM|nr:TBC1 domain family member 19 [Lepeophtheirus salmonis]CAF3040882.1 TBC1 domain family member 19 [Lepeophtheirus salmonis]
MDDKDYSDAIAERLSAEIRSQESLHKGLYRDLLKIAASPSVHEEDFHTTFLKALSRSGIETRLQNAVFHLLRTKGPEEWVRPADRNKKKEPLSYIVKIQTCWEKRILKSLNAMANELGLCLAKIRSQEEQDEISNKWSELSTLDLNLSLIRPVYAPKDFLEVLAQITSPNAVDLPGKTDNGANHSHTWGMIKVSFATLSLKQLFYLSLPQHQNQNTTMESERYSLGTKVLKCNHAPLSQEFLKSGSPHSLRGKIWSQVLGSEVGEKGIEYYESLKASVIRNDILVDKLIIKDIQLTASNDDNYFVFEDTILQVLLCFSRDTEVLTKFQYRSTTPAKATLRSIGMSKNMNGNPHGNTVIYPPNGVIPFHGFAIAFYLQFACKLHEISSDSQGILSLCSTFETLLQSQEPDLWTHFVNLDVTQPLRCVFRWIIRGFSGHLPPEQLLYLWDVVLAYDSMEIFPLLAAVILSYRKDNLMMVSTLQGIEAVLADLSSLPIIPLLQLALEKR